MKSLEMQVEQVVLKNLSASTALIQRHLKLDYREADAILQRLEGRFVSPPDEQGRRSVLPLAVAIAHGQGGPDYNVHAECAVNRPIENSYWVLPGHLLAGEYPGGQKPAQAQEKLSQFLKHGITAFLDLTQSGELVPYAPLLNARTAPDGRAYQYRRMAIEDMGTPSSKNTMKEILDQIEGWLMDRQKVYVHCWGGIGRTGTVIGCHLVRNGMRGEKALAHVQMIYDQMSIDKRLRHPRSPQTVRQIAYVQNWASMEASI